ncbi:peroxin 19-1 [Perilla frutescens var. hirtella]|uniref:Peroxin 19-1 n=1 Tax=Perilla frutescens var. hirtella TaxID=608512 RepID=A0AAD4IP46_PERFH|nr:peroxin 19-1 [Perilla frutescens var. hirtella]
MLRKFPGHGFGTDHQVCILYGGCKSEVRTLMDAAAGGSLLARGPDEAMRIIEKMASNSFLWPIEAFPTPKPETSQTPFEEVNYVNQGGYQNQQRLYNQGDIVPPPEFFVTNGVIDEEKKPKMEDLLMAFMGKTEKYMADSQVRMGKLETNFGAIGIQVNQLKKQMSQLATIIGNQHQQGKFPSNTTVNPKYQCKAITLRSGTTYTGPKMPKYDEDVGEESSSQKAKQDEQNEESEEIEHSKEKETSTKENVESPPKGNEEPRVHVPYPQDLQKKKNEEQFSRFLDIFQKVQAMRHKEEEMQCEEECKVLEMVNSCMELEHTLEHILDIALVDTVSLINSLQEDYLRKPKFLPLKKDEQTSTVEEPKNDKMELKPLPPHLRGVDNNGDKGDNTQQGCRGNVQGLEMRLPDLKIKKKGKQKHVAEILYDNQLVVERNGVSHGAVTYLDKIKLLKNNLLVAHMIWMNEHDVGLLSRVGVKVSHCHVATMRMPGFAPIKEMSNTCVCVSLRTDGTPSNNRMSMVDEMYLASLINEGREVFRKGTIDPIALPAETILEMATINGAKSVLWDKEIGSLRLGKEPISNEKLVRKVLRSLLRKFAYKVAAIEEAKDIKSMRLDELMGSLRRFEMNLDDEDSSSRKRGIALKTEVSEDVPEHIQKQKSVFYLDTMNNMVLITKNFSRMLKRVNKHSSRRSNNRRQSSSNPQKCDHFGHIQAECANTLKKNKKNYNASLNDNDSEESSIESEEETYAFTAKVSEFQDHFKLAADEDSDNEDFSHEEFVQTYKEISNSEQKLIIQQRKKEIEELSAELKSIKRNVNMLNNGTENLDKFLTNPGHSGKSHPSLGYNGG